MYIQHISASFWRVNMPCPVTSPLFIIFFSKSYVCETRLIFIKKEVIDRNSSGNRVSFNLWTKLCHFWEHFWRGVQEDGGGEQARTD